MNISARNIYRLGIALLLIVPSSCAFAAVIPPITNVVLTLPSRDRTPQNSDVSSNQDNVTPGAPGGTVITGSQTFAVTVNSPTDTPSTGNNGGAISGSGGAGGGGGGGGVVSTGGESAYASARNSLNRSLITITI